MKWIRKCLEINLFIISIAGCEHKITGDDAGLLSLSLWDEIPVFHKYSYYQFSSYDRGLKIYPPIIDPGNKDFNNFLAVCGYRRELIYQETDGEIDGCDVNNGGYLLAYSNNGPGFVTRIWLGTLNALTQETFEDEIIKVFIDDLDVPSYEGKISEWGKEEASPFSEPLAGWRSGCYVSYVPISFQSKIRVLLDNLSPFKIYYYQVDIQEIDKDTMPFNRNNFSGVVFNNAKNNILQSGMNPNTNFSIIRDDILVTLKHKSKTTVLDYYGTGTIELIEFEFQNISLSELQNLKLNILWDGRDKPSASVPLSAFFGVHLKIVEFNTLPMSVKKDGDSIKLSFFLPMPFKSSVKILIENNNNHDIEVKKIFGIDPKLPDGDWGYFNAYFKSIEAPVQKGSLYEVISLNGTGKYVGTFMFLEGHKGYIFISDPFNFLEGDEIGLIDGEKKILGTGTEDYFNGGFYFIDGEYNSPFSGINLKEKSNDGTKGAVSVYRWHILTDEINFKGSFNLKLEYSANKPEIIDRYSSVAFFYIR